MSNKMSFAKEIEERISAASQQMALKKSMGIQRANLNAMTKGQNGRDGKFESAAHQFSWCSLVELILVDTEEKEIKACDMSCGVPPDLQKELDMLRGKCGKVLVRFEGVSGMACEIESKVMFRLISQWFGQPLCMATQNHENTQGAILSPVRLPFRHTGNV